MHITLHEAARRGNAEQVPPQPLLPPPPLSPPARRSRSFPPPSPSSQVAMIASSIASLASKGELAAVRELLDGAGRGAPELALSTTTCHVSPSPRGGGGLACAESPTILYDGAGSPSPPAAAHSNQNEGPRFLVVVSPCWQA